LRKIDLLFIFKIVV